MATISKTLEITSEGVYSLSFSAAPDGSTVTPVNDIQTWLHCANIWDKDYTTLDEVLDDPITLLSLISSNNAVDYMVRSHDWCENPGLVPVMTSNTAPSGEVIVSHEHSSGYAGWKVFDGDDTTAWSSALGYVPAYVGYHFTSPTVIRRFRMKVLRNSDGLQIKDYSIQGSNDGFASDVHNLYSGTVSSDTTDGTVISGNFENSTAYSYYRIYISTSYITAAALYSLQFYAYNYDKSIVEDETAMTYIGANNYAADTLLADSNEGLVPTMTSDTTPSGECLYSDEYYTRYAYYAFDNNWDKTVNASAAITAFNGWASGSSRNVYLGYDFGEAVTISQVAFRSGGYASASYLIDTYKIQYSDDNSIWTDATTELTAAKTHDKQVVTLSSASSHRYWRLFVVFNGLDTYATLVSNLQFYAKDGSWLEAICNSTYFESVLNVKVPEMTSNTTPAGYVASASSILTGGASTYYAYGPWATGKAWYSAQDSSPQWVRVEVPTAYVPKRIDAQISWRYMYIEGSNDGSTWVRLSDEEKAGNVKWIISSNAAYKYFRLYSRSQTGYVGVGTCQIYGRAASS